MYKYIQSELNDKKYHPERKKFMNSVTCNLQTMQYTIYSWTNGYEHNIMTFQMK